MEQDKRATAREGAPCEARTLRDLRPPRFADLLRRYRLAVGLTQEELAERATLSARAVSDLERGLRTRPQRETIRLLADALHLNPDERDNLLAAARPAAAERPAPPPMPLVPGNLPTPPTPLIGRADAVAAAVDRLRAPEVRLLTITGPGGVGKSRLALAIAEVARPEFPQGVFFVALAPLTEPTLLVTAIAEALDIAEEGPQSLHDTVLAALREQRLLLLLDNFEHLLPAVAFVDQILATCRGVKILATSRAALPSQWQHEEPVPPLALPATGLLDTAALAQIPAVALFVARARAVRPEFHLTQAEAPAIVAICQRLDGMPLALELAAARVRLLSPRALLDRLATPLRLLTGGAPGRQGTLRGTIAWSHDLLDADEQRLFRRLTVFSGGGAIDAIEAVCAEPEATRDPLDCAESLVAQSLVRRVDGADGEPRLTLFETIREYGQEQLAATGEVAETRERHAAYYLALAEEAAPHLTAATQGVWLARLEAEGDNLRTALRHWLDAADSAAALRMTGALWRFWYLRGYFGEGQRWLTEALALPCDETIPTIAAARALAFYGVSTLTALQRDLAQAEVYGEASLALRRRLGDQAGTADTLHTLAFIARERRDLPRAVALNEESLALRRALGDNWAVSVSLVNLGQLARDRGDYRRAFTLTEESLALKRTLGDRQGLAIALNNLAEITGHLLGPAAARPRYEESLALAREVGSRPDEALALENLGAISIMTGEYARAVTLLSEAVAHYRALGASGGLASSLTNLGLVRHQLGDTVRATALHEESLTIARAADNSWGTALALTNLSALALSGGDLAGAVVRGEEGLALFRAIEDGWDTIGALAGLARAVLAQGDRERAATLWREALTRAETMGAQDSLAPSLEGLATLAADSDPTQAVRLCGAAAALRERLGTPLQATDRADHDQLLTALRDTLGGPAYADALAAGRAINPDTILALAIPEQSQGTDGH